METWTDKVEIKKNILKSNLRYGDNISEETLDNMAMDMVNYEEQKEEKKNIITKESLDMIHKKNELTELQKYLNDFYGSFYFNFYKRIPNLDKGVMFRFIYLCTYMDFNNYLVNDNKRLIHHEKLNDYLKLTKTLYFKTKKELIKNNLIEIEDDGYIKINKKYCKKGKVIKTKSIEMVRIFDSSIREIYNKSKSSEHKKLCLLLDILPFVNLKYNVLCENPKEEYIERIIPLSLKDVCNILNYNTNNVYKFKKDLIKLTLNDIPVIGFFETYNRNMIYVNPTLYYKGTNKEDIINLEAMFNIVR